MQKKRKTTTLFLIVSAALVMGACSSGSSSDGSSGTEVALRNIKFQPGEVTVAVGDAITWTNEDDVEHTVTSGKGQEQGVPGVSENTESDPDGTFDSAMPPGESFSFTFEDVGTFEYFCGIHPGMTGTVTVE